MITRKTITLLAYLLLQVSGIQSQDIHLSLGNKTKTFKAGTFLEIILPAPGTVPCDKCSFNVVKGKLVSYQQEVVTMVLYEKKEVLVTDGKIMGYRETGYTKNMSIANIEIPKTDILSIAQSGKKKLKTMTTGTTIATVIGLVGLGHIVSAPLADDKAELLVGLGVAEVVVAIILGTTSSPKTYRTHINCPEQPKESKEIWIWE